ncbi:hypothetical protein LCGC14_2928460, partial [marine sediment metagenome]
YIHLQVGFARGEDVAPPPVGEAPVGEAPVGEAAVEEESGEVKPPSEGSPHGNGLFSVDACRSAYQVTGGVPRLINQLCDHALMLAYVAGSSQISSADVDEAWADLQQLPTPWNEQNRDEGSSGVIEFGGLDDSPEEIGPTCDEEQTTPSLRISPATEQGELEVTEPTAQLDRIEGMLSDAEEEFRPIGSIRPEVELVFVDPFEEEFEQEEVVVDRYDRPAAVEQAEPAAGRAEGSPNEPTDDAEIGLSAQDQSAKAGSVASDLGLEPRTVPLPARKQKEATQPNDENMDDENMDDEDLNDEDLLVAEGDRDDGVVATCPMVAVPRREFGQLFAKLRRG